MTDEPLERDGDGALQQAARRVLHARIPRRDRGSERKRKSPGWTKLVLPLASVVLLGVAAAAAVAIVRLNGAPI